MKTALKVWPIYDSLRYLYILLSFGSYYIFSFNSLAAKWVGRAGTQASPVLGV